MNSTRQTISWNEIQWYCFSLLDFTPTVDEISEWYGTPEKYLDPTIEYKLNPDPNFFNDLEKHLELNDEYRADRRRYHAKHPNKSLRKNKHDFYINFSETFLDDLKDFRSWFLTVFPDGTPDEKLEDMTLKFQSEWKWYDALCGHEFVKRGFKLVDSRESSSIYPKKLIRGTIYP